MFAFLGLGYVEIIVLGVLAALFAGLAIFVVSTITRLALRPAKKSWNDYEIAELRAEVRRLREDVDRLKKAARPDAGSAGISEHPG